MKFTVTFKSPDAVDDALADIPANQRKKAEKICEEFFKYGEYVYVEIDTDAGTATVLQV